MAAAMIATNATSPIVSPTAPPVPSPPPLPFFAGASPLVACAFGGTVGVTVTVRTWPVMVSKDVTGVGVHVEDVEAVDEDCCVVIVDSVFYE